MSALEAALLGLVQGLTEFLPVSSSGHLVMFQALLGVRQPGVLFEIVVHVATLASVLIFFRRRVARLVAGVLGGRRDELRYAAKLAVATLPAVAAAFSAGDFLEFQFEIPAVAGACLLVTGAILWSTRRTLASAGLEEPDFRAALWIGCAQALAILPGISRSGATVAAALALGVAPAAAAEFSFLMSVIAVGGAALRAAPELAQVSPDHTAALAMGGATALASGLLAIWIFLRALAMRSFFRFAYYTWIVGAGFLLWLLAVG